MKCNVAVLLLLCDSLPVIAQNNANENVKPMSVLSVCDLRAPNGFATYYNTLVAVAGQIDAVPEVTVLSGGGCDKGVLIVEAESLQKSNSPLLTVFRARIKGEMGCHSGRPLHAVVRGRLGMTENANGRFYKFTVVEVLKAVTEDASTACPPVGKLEPSPAPKVFPEPVQVVGRVIAFHGANHVFADFERIHIEHFIIRIEREINDKPAPPYVRVDFFWGGAPHLEDYKLPDTFFEPGHVWRLKLIPPSMASIENETCRADVDYSITADENGREVGIGSAFTVLESAIDMPTLGDLPCYVVRKDDIVLVR
jgi:hypothetical protein